MSKRKRQAEVRSIRALAKLVGRSHVAVAAWLKRPDWSFGGPPWSSETVARIRVWMAGLAVDPAKETDAVMKRARLAVLVERAAKMKVEREMIQKGWIKREEVEVQAVARILSVKAKMQEVPTRAHLLVGKNEAEIAVELTAWMKAICDHYANGGN